MVKTHDNFFDQKWISELASQLINESWSPNNVANRNTFPNMETGTHRLFGKLFYYRHTNDYIHYDNSNMNLVKNLIDAFQHIRNKTNLKMNLTEISGNLQFKNMDGSYHCDGPENRRVFILMLCNEKISKKIGGEFFHYPSKKKILFEQGRLIEMTASDLHKANAFNKAHIARMSIKWVGELI